MYYKWSKEFLEAGKSHLIGNRKRQADNKEVKELRLENEEMKYFIAKLSLDNRGVKNHIWHEEEEMKGLLRRKLE